MANVYGFDPVAWSVDGGLHRGELLRFLAYAATNGGEGVVAPADCKVHQLSTPGPQVRIDAGGVLIPNRNAGVRNQTYAANGRTETRLDVAATGGSPRHDLVIVRIEDPQYSGFPKPPVGQEANWQYCKPFILQGVPLGTKTFAELNLGYSATELARIEIPAGTTTITDGMIKDLRQLPSPRFQPATDLIAPPARELLASQTSYVNFPDVAMSTTVPRWATHATVVIRGAVMGLGAGAGNGNGSADGHAQVLFDDLQSANFSVLDHNTNSSQGLNDGLSVPYTAYGEFNLDIPGNIKQGKTLTVRPRTKHVGGGITTGKFISNSAMPIEIRIDYFEKVV